MLNAPDLVLIHQLLARYGQAIDDRDWSAFRDLFTSDATVDYTGTGLPRVLRGVDDVVDQLRRSDHPPAHHVLNIVVDERARATDQVHVRSKFLVPFDDPAGTHRIFGGDYRDVVTKHDDRWKFVARTCVTRWQFPT